MEAHMSRPTGPSGGRASGPPADPIAAGTPPDSLPHFPPLVARTATVKRAVSATLDSVAAPRALAHADRWARTLSAEIDPRSSPARVDEFALALSAHVIGSLLAMPDEALPAAERCVGQYTGGGSPGASAG